jgi:hypothetical protein
MAPCRSVPKRHMAIMLTRGWAHTRTAASTDASGAAARVRCTRRTVCGCRQLLRGAMRARSGWVGLTNVKAELCGRTERDRTERTGSARRRRRVRAAARVRVDQRRGAAAPEVVLLQERPPLQQETYNMQHATCSMSHAACRMQQATRDIHHAPAALVLAASVAHPAGAVPDARQHLRHRAVHS